MTQATTASAEEIGQRIADELHRRRIAQQAFAPRVGMSRTGLYRRLTGRVELTVSEIHAIARELGVSVDWLLGATEAVA